jgi:hypothetical protein
MINIHSTLRTAPDLCKNISLAVLFGRNGNLYTVFRQADMCIYTHILHDVETLVGQTKYKKWDNSEGRVPKKSFRLPFWAPAS